MKLFLWIFFHLKYQRKSRKNCFILEESFFSRNRFLTTTEMNHALLSDLPLQCWIILKSFALFRREQYKKERDGRKSERVREKRCSSLPEFDSQNIEFLQKGERMDTVVSPKNGKVRSRATKRVACHLFFLSLRISYKCSPLTLTARVPCREGKISPFELHEKSRGDGRF